jgi:hypothetical protein
MQLTTSGRKRWLMSFFLAILAPAFSVRLYSLFALCLFFFALMVRYPVLDGGLAGNASRPFQALT